MYHVEKNCENCLSSCGLRRIGQPWTVCAYAVIQQQETILLVKLEGQTEWTLPGGKIPTGISVEDALRDHILRATGLEVLMRFQPHVRECPHKHNFLLYREAVPTCWSLNSPSPEKDPAIEAEWFALSRIPRSLAKHAKSYLFHERILESPKGTQQLKSAS